MSGFSARCYLLMVAPNVIIRSETRKKGNAVYILNNSFLFVIGNATSQSFLPVALYLLFSHCFKWLIPGQFNKLNGCI